HTRFSRDWSSDVCSSDLHVTNDHLPQARQVELRRARIQSGLSLDMADTEVVDILGRLGLSLETESAEGWLFSIPSYRFDIAIEEIGRASCRERGESAGGD